MSTFFLAQAKCETNTPKETMIQFDEHGNATERSSGVYVQPCGFAEKFQGLLVHLFVSASAQMLQVLLSGDDEFFCLGFMRFRCFFCCLFSSIQVMTENTFCLHFLGI